MVRPQKDRVIGFNPETSYFKPRGIPMVALDEVCLTVDEREAIRLADYLGLTHEAAGREMGISRATFGRIIQKARQTVADALINGKAIRVGGGNYKIAKDPRRFHCLDCDNRWEETRGTGRPDKCPKCDKSRIHRYHDERS